MNENTELDAIFCVIVLHYNKVIYKEIIMTIYWMVDYFDTEDKKKEDEAEIFCHQLEGGCGSLPRRSGRR